MTPVSFTPVSGIGDVRRGDDLARVLADALVASGLSPAPGDILVVAQKVVSKAEGRLVDLGTVEPTARAQEIAALTGKDARLVELILSESSDVLRAVPGVLIVRHRRGYVVANAGIDRSNVGNGPAGRYALMLPVDPDASAENLRRRLRDFFAVDVGVIVSDSFGRAWRNGVVNVALGAAGVPALVDRRGEVDRYGRKLEMTEVAAADAVAAGAGLVMGEAAEGRPAVLVRGLSWTAPFCNAQALIRPPAMDLFP